MPKNIQTIIKRQKIAFYFLQALFAYHQVTHDVFDPSREFEQNYEGMKSFAYYMSSQSFYIGDNTKLTLLGLYICNLNYQITMIMVLSSYISTMMFIKNHKYYSALFGDYIFNICYSVMVGFALCYLDTKAQKEKFLAEKKI